MENTKYEKWGYGYKVIDEFGFDESKFPVDIYWYLKEMVKPFDGFVPQDKINDLLDMIADVCANFGEDLAKARRTIYYTAKLLQILSERSYSDYRDVLLPMGAMGCDNILEVAEYASGLRVLPSAARFFEAICGSKITDEQRSKAALDYYEAKKCENTYGEPCLGDDE